MASPLLEDEHLAPPLPASDDEPAETRRPWTRCVMHLHNNMLRSKFMAAYCCQTMHLEFSLGIAGPDQIFQIFPPCHILSFFL